MGKKNKCNLRNVREIENKSASKSLHQVESMKNQGKTLKNIDPTLMRKSKVADQENSMHESSLQVSRKTRKKKKKTIGNPIIVEDSVEEFPTIPLPLSQKVPQSPTITSVSLNSLSFHLRKRKKKKSCNNFSVTIAECVRPAWTTEKILEKSAFPQNGECSMEVESAEIISTKDDRGPSCSKKSTTSKNVESTQSKNRQERKDASAVAEKAEPSMDANCANNAPILPQFYSFRNKVLAIMKNDCKFCFHGKLKIRVLYGAVRIYGYSAREAQTEISPLYVYAPRAYSPIAIETADSETTMKNVSKIWRHLKEECSDNKFANRLRSDVESVEEGWAILMLENFDNRLTNYLDENFPHRLFPRIDDPSNYSWLDNRRADVVLRSNLRSDDYYQKIVIDSRGIDDIADAISYDWENKKNSRTIVAGGKCVGKSTTARYVVNKLLGSSDTVVFLDLDPGQPEFTPAGCLSLSIVEEPLLGPNFTHLRSPYYQLYVGNADINRCLTRYIDSVKKLVDRLNDDPKLCNKPVVVNTMGYCRDIGRDIMTYVIKILFPTDVIQIISKRPKNNYDDTLSRQVIDRRNLGWINWRKENGAKEKLARHRLHVIYSEAETSTGPAECWNLEAYQQRDLAMISYLGGIAKNTGLPAIRGLSSGINATPPYVVPFAAVSVALTDALIPQVLSVMNGNIVALCGVDPELTKKSNTENTTAVSYPEVLIKPPLSTCYGFGILRGVDMEKEQLFINTPLSLSNMKHVNCLVGSTNIPRSLLRLDQQGAPYTGNEFDLPTSRGPRRGYVRARYQAET